MPVSASNPYVPSTSVSQCGDCGFHHDPFEAHQNNRWKYRKEYLHDVIAAAQRELAMLEAYEKRKSVTPASTQSP